MVYITYIMLYNSIVDNFIQDSLGPKYALLNFRFILKNVLTFYFLEAAPVEIAPTESTKENVILLRW